MRALILGRVLCAVCLVPEPSTETWQGASEDGDNAVCLWVEALLPGAGQCDSDASFLEAGDDLCDDEPPEEGEH